METIPRSVVAMALCVSSALWSLQAQAEPAFARLYKNQFGYVPSCNACHRDGGGSALNPYGEAFKAAGSGVAAFASISSLDSDDDGASNGEEAAAKANPGDPASKPGRTGQWLSIDQLIPRSVREAFPQARQFKPVDALLTQTEMARAKAWGVRLQAADENTIYVPVIEGKAAGTALIVRGEHQEQAFFLLVVTDRQLALTQLLPVAGLEALPAGLEQALSGARAETFPQGSADGLQAALEQAVHRALALVQVRLSKG